LLTTLRVSRIAARLAAVLLLQNQHVQAFGRWGFPWNRTVSSQQCPGVLAQGVAIGRLFWRGNTGRASPSCALSTEEPITIYVPFRERAGRTLHPSSCYYRQDRHQDPLHLGSRPKASSPQSPVPSYTSWHSFLSKVSACLVMTAGTRS